MTYDAAALKAELEQDEGRKLQSYRDQYGNITVGVGHNINANGISITDETADLNYTNDVDKAEAALDKGVSWWRDLPDVWQRVLINLCFNMGWGTLSTFTTFLGLVQGGQYDAALDDLATTAWAKETGTRFTRIKARVSAAGA